jgi:hypothetical protein
MNAIRKFPTISLLALPALLISVLSIPAGAEEGANIQAGQTVFTFVNRLLINPPQATVIGYLPTIEGLPGYLFDLSNPNNPPSEKTAYFTMVIDATGALLLSNGDTTTPAGTSVAILPADITKIYFHENPAQNWSDTGSFSSGLLVATFKSSTGTQTAAGLVALVTQSSVLMSSHDFTFKGHTYNFARLIPNGYTVHALSSGVPVEGTNVPPPFTFTGAGSAVALGRR